MDGEVVNPILTSRKKAALLLGISPGTLTNLIRVGELSPIRVGTRTLFRRRDLENFSRRKHHKTATSKSRKSTQKA